MSAITSATIEVLEPHLGVVLAQGCARAASAECGKPPEDLTTEDWPVVERTVRAFLRPVAPHSAIDTLIDRIKVMAGA